MRRSERGAYHPLNNRSVGSLSRCCDGICGTFLDPAHPVNPVCSVCFIASLFQEKIGQDEQDFSGKEF